MIKSSLLTKLLALVTLVAILLIGCTTQNTGTSNQPTTGTITQTSATTQATTTAATTTNATTKPTTAATTERQIPVEEKHVYVSPDGDNFNDGSKENPYKTISRAITGAKPGHVIHVLPGVYEETFSIEKSGTENGRIRVVSEEKWKAKIVDMNYKLPVGISGSYVDFEGFEVTGNYTSGITIRGNHVRVIGCHVYGFAPPDALTSYNGGSGIVTYNSGYTMHDIDIIGNVVHDIGQGENKFIHGIYTAGKDVRVVNNICYNNAGYGIHAWHAADQNVFANNLVFGNRTGGIVLGAGDSPGGVTADNFIVANNIVINNKGYAIVESGATGKNNKFLNNLVFGNENGFLLQNGLKDENTITADPKLVKFTLDGKGDYHLTDKSPAIDAGTDIYKVEFDYDGNPRPSGSAIDIGPFEFKAK